MDYSIAIDTAIKSAINYTHKMMMMCKQHNKDFLSVACIPNGDIAAILEFNNEKDKCLKLMELGKIAKQKKADGVITIVDAWYSNDNVLPLQKPQDDRTSAIAIQWHDLKNNGLNNKMLVVKYNTRKEILSEEPILKSEGNIFTYIKAGYDLMFGDTIGADK